MVVISELIEVVSLDSLFKQGCVICVKQLAFCMCAMSIRVQRTTQEESNVTRSTTSKNHLPINRREFLASFFGSKEKVIQSEIAVNDRQWRLCILIPYWNKVVAQFFGYIK